MYIPIFVYHESGKLKISRNLVHPSQARSAALKF